MLHLTCYGAQTKGIVARALLMTMGGTQDRKPNCANALKASAHIMSTSISLAKASCMTSMDGVVKYAAPTRVHR